MGIEDILKIIELVESAENQTSTRNTGAVAIYPAPKSTRIERFTMHAPGKYTLKGPGRIQELVLESPCDVRLEVEVDNYILFGDYASKLAQDSLFVQVFTAYQTDGKWVLIVRGIDFTDHVTVKIEGCTVSVFLRWEEVVV